MLNNFIYAQTKDLFLEALNAENILDEAIVFIEDTKEIWNRGHYFGGSSGSGIDSEIISELQTAIAALQSNKVDKNELADYALKSELPSLDEYLTKAVADGLYATIAQYNALNQTVGNIQTELSSKLTSSDLADYAKTADVPTKISDLTDDSDFITNTDATAAYAPKSLVTTVSDQATTISTLATKNELSTGLAKKLDNSAASGFVPTTRKVNGKALDTDITITATDPNAATKDSLNNVNTDLQNFKNSVALTYATDKDVADAIANLVDSSPETLNTLDELAAALGDDPNFATTVSNLIGTKASQDALNETNTNVANLMRVLDGKLDKTGGTITGALALSKEGSDIFVINRLNSSSPTTITYRKDDVLLGRMGFDASTYEPVAQVFGTYHTLIHSGNVGEYNAGSADVIAKTYKNESINYRSESRVRMISLTASNSIDLGAPKQYVSGLSVMSDYVGWQLVSGASEWDNTDFYIRKLADNGKYLAWKQIAFTDSTVEAATKLQTARTIWGRPFDGTGDVSGHLTLNNQSAIQSYTTSGAQLELFNISSNNNLSIGYSMAGVGDSYIYGNAIYLNYGPSRTAGLVLNSSGNVTIGDYDVAGKDAKLWIKGKTVFSDSPDQWTAVDLSSVKFHLAESNPYGYHTGSFLVRGDTSLAGFGFRGDKDGLYYTYIGNNADNPWLAIKTNGNVLIGTTDDNGYKLDVNGSFNATSGNINGNAIIHAGNIGSQSVNYADSAGSATDQTARNAAATAQSTANGKWTYSESTIKAVKVNNAGYADSAGSAGSVAWTNVSGRPSSLPANGGNADTVDGYHATQGNNKPWGTIPAITSTGYMDVGRHFEFHYDNTTGSDFSTVLGCTGNYSNIVSLPSRSGTLALHGDAQPASDVYAWAKAVNKPSYSWSEISGKPTFATVATSGSYNDLSNKPTIPTNTNQLTNGAGYVTSSGVTSVATGTGLTGGTITSTGTISINTTYQGYITNGNNAWASHTKLAANKINAIPVTHKVVTCPISAAGSFAISGTMTAGQVIHVIVQNTTTSAKTVTIPNSGSYHSFSGTSLSVPASKYAEINVVYNGEKMFIRTAY